MNICVDARMALSSGIGTIIQNFILNFSGEFHLVLIGNPDELAPMTATKTNYEIIPCTTPIYSIKEQRELPRLIPKCDVFWSPHYNIPLLPIKARKRLVNVNDVFHLAFAHNGSFAKRLYATLLIRQAVHRSDRVITISKFSEAEVIKYAGKKKSGLDIIYCGVDHDLFKINNDQNELSNLRSKYNLPQKYILCVGNVKPHKNLRNLIRALKLLGPQTDDYKVVVVGKKQGFITGDPLLFQEIEQDPVLSQRVIFTGFVPNEDLPGLYNLASLFVFPSYYEGFGLPPLEAMACGCPVVVSNAASIPEVCGDAATYFDPFNVQEIANQIEISLKSDNTERKKKGIERAKMFSWKDYYVKQSEIIHQLAK